MEIENKNTQQRYNLPTEVIFCAKCTISNQRPRISFDEKGVCSACNFAEFKQNKINWSEREKEFITLLNTFSKEDETYDGLVP